MNNLNANVFFAEEVDHLQIIKENDPVPNPCETEEIFIKSEINLQADLSDSANIDKCYEYDDLLLNEITVKTKRRIFCDVCFKTFKCNSDFVTHYRIHTNYKPFICSVCKKGFRCQRYLDLHVVTHSSDSRFVCKICMRFYKDRRDLHNHSKLHSGKKHVKCNVCGASFLYKQGLVAHRIENPKCNTVIPEDLLKWHNEKYKNAIRTDSKENPVYKCSVCSKVVKTMLNLKIHIKTHSNPKSPNYVPTFHDRIDLT